MAPVSPRKMTAKRVMQRIQWEPCHPFEEEFYQLALQRAEDSLLDKKARED
jgi:hypothetical protein